MLTLLLGLALLPPPTVLTPAERELVERIDDERVGAGLPPVGVSAALMAVARAHVWDLETNHPDDVADGGRCTLHSWSANGWWNPVCYTADQASAAAMWSKPAEVTRGAYPGYGVEIAGWSPVATPAVMTATWRESPAHTAVIRETGAWHGRKWQAMGVAIGGHYAVVWFGADHDPGRPVTP